MNYKSWPDEDLRRVLLTDPDDTLAVCEAAERFAKQYVTADEDIEVEFEIPVTCPECNHEWEESINRTDYV